MIFQLSEATMGKFTEFNVALKGLSDGVHKQTFKLGPTFFANMENEDIRDANVDVDLTITVAAGRYDMDFKCTGEVVTLCDRCLDDLHLPIDAGYRIMVEYGDSFNDDSDTLLIIPKSEASLNVAYMIYDTVALAIPVKHVHPMGKCNRQMSALLRKHRAKGSDEDAALEEELMEGIDAADDAPSDPRWDALKGLGSAEN